MIELDFKGANPLQVKENLVKEMPWLKDKIQGFTDENGRSYVRIDYDLMIYKIREIINKTIYEQNQQLPIKEKEQPMAEEKSKFTFASIMEREITAELDKELAGSRKDMAAFKAELETKKAELQKAADEYKAEAAKKLAEIDSVVKASEVAQEKKMDGKLAPILDTIKILIAFMEKLRAFYKGL